VKCPKCHYTSFDFLQNCKKCGADLSAVARSGFGIRGARSVADLPHQPDSPPTDPHSSPSESIKIDREEDPSSVDGGLPPLSIDPLPPLTDNWGEPEATGDLSGVSSSEHPGDDDDLFIEPPGKNSYLDSEFSAADPGSSGAPPLPRIAACAVDLLVLAGILVLFMTAGELALLPAERGFFFTPGNLLEAAAPLFLIIFSVFFFYFTLFHFLVGQTPGKMLFRLRLEREEYGEPLLFSQAFLHSTGGLLSLAAFGLGYFRILFDQDRRGWNDRLAGSRTVVVSRETGELLKIWAGAEIGPEEGETEGGEAATSSGWYPER
jgi:uncharacterized RDD family membrane protein YckC